MAPARFVDCAPESVICNPSAIGPPRWAPIGPTMATCATNLTNPANPAEFFGVPKYSGLYLFLTFCFSWYPANLSPVFRENRCSALSSPPQIIWSENYLCNLFLAGKIPSSNPAENPIRTFDWPAKFWWPLKDDGFLFRSSELYNKILLWPVVTNIL